MGQRCGVHTLSAPPARAPRAVQPPARVRTRARARLRRWEEPRTAAGAIISERRPRPQTSHQRSGAARSGDLGPAARTRSRRRPDAAACRRRLHAAHTPFRSGPLVSPSLHIAHPAQRPPTATAPNVFNQAPPDKPHTRPPPTPTRRLPPTSSSRNHAFKPPPARPPGQQPSSRCPATRASGIPHKDPAQPCPPRLRALSSPARRALASLRSSSPPRPMAASGGIRFSRQQQWRAEQPKVTAASGGARPRPGRLRYPASSAQVNARTPAYSALPERQSQAPMSLR